MDVVEGILLAAGLGLGGYAVWKVAGGGAAAATAAPPSPPSGQCSASGVSLPCSYVAKAIGKTATVLKNVGEALIPGHSTCSGSCLWPDLAMARAKINTIPNTFGLRDCVRSKCSEKFGVQI